MTRVRMTPSAAPIRHYVRDAAERLSSFDRMKAEHVARCNGCHLCQPDQHRSPGPSQVVLESDTPEVISHKPGRPAPAEAVSPEATEAREYIRSYTGTWDLMLSFQRDQRERGSFFRLSDRMIDIILRSKAREAAWAAEREAKAASWKEAPTVAQLPEGRRYYAVDNDKGTTTFLRITRTKVNPDIGRGGWTYVDQVIGGGYGIDGSPEPRGRVTTSGQYLGTFQALYEKVVADPEAAMARFGHEIGKCGYCARTLTDPESRTRGIGPVCAKKAGF